MKINYYKRQKALHVPIDDAGNYFTGLNVEAALQEIADGTTLDGRYIKKTPDANDNLITVTTADKSALILQTTDNSAVKNLLETLASDGTTVTSSISAIGNPTFNTTDPTLTLSNSAGANQVNNGRIFFQENTNQGFYFQHNGNANRFYWGFRTGGADTNVLEMTTTDGSILITSPDTTVIPLTIKAATEQAANLTEWRGRGGGVLSSISSDGRLGIGINASSSYRAYFFENSSATSGTIIDQYNLLQPALSTDSSANYFAQYNRVLLSQSYDVNITGSLNATYTILDFRGDTLTAGYGQRILIDSQIGTNSPTATNLFGQHITISDGSWDSVTSAYGLYIAGVTVATNNYAIYTNLGLNRFGDDVFFEGEGSGLLFAEIYAFDTNTTITIAGTGIANKVQVTSFAVDGLSNGMTPDHTNDHITVVKAGKYKLNVSISAESAGGTAYEAGFGVFKNNGATHFTNCHAHRALSGGGGDTGSISMTGIIDLAVNDTIEVWVWNETNTNNVIVDDITMNLVMLGGT